MALFADVQVDSPRPRRRGRRIGVVLLVLAIIAGIALATVPTPYVIEQPGPVFNTLGTVQNSGNAVPLIEIPGQKTYPTSGALDLLTVNLLGDRQNPPNWFEVAQAWFDPSKAVVPIDAVYPKGETVEQSDKQSAVDMQNSQKDAVAAALTQLGYPLTGTLVVEGFSADSPSKGVLQNGDEILAVDGTKTDSVAGLRAIIAKTGAGVPVAVSIARKGVDSTVQVTPALSTEDGKTPILGIYPSISYTFPFQVKIQLDNVGGPSAGQMFALGIIDKLTPGKLNGGAKVAGTGTIDAEGDVGPIGGIRQKLYGARDAGATWFLAPQSNCNEVTGHIPSGLKVFAVKTLDDSLAALKAIRTGGDTSALPSCPVK